MSDVDESGPWVLPARPSLPEAEPSGTAAPLVLPSLPEAVVPPKPIVAAQPVAPVALAAKTRGRRGKQPVAPPAATGPAPLPSPGESNKDSLELLRQQAARTRKRNQRRARLFILFFLVVVWGALAGVVYLFVSEDKKENEPDVSVPTSFTAEDAGAAAAGGIIPAAEAAGAIDGAQRVVDQVNGVDAAAPIGAPVTRTLADVTRDQLLPTLLEPLAQSLGVDAASGLDRYVVDGPTVAAIDGETYAEWIAVLRSLPQSPDPVAARSAGVLPQLGSGEIGLSFATKDGKFTRLVVVTADNSATVDATA